MTERAWFIPGRPGAPADPLARYRPIQAVRAVEAYVRDFATPGDLVVDLFCQGSVVLEEAVAAGCRAVGLSVNPLLLVAAHMGLGRPGSAALNAAFTQLADSSKGDLLLRQHLDSLYRSTCPVCGADGAAEWFAWDRDGHYPFKKSVRCPTCDASQEGVPDDGDIEALRRFQPRGLPYYYALDRVAPPSHPARGRAAELVELYTPRNLSALMDLALRLETLQVDQDTKLALTAVLLECFDAGSNLDPFDDERPRPRTLRVPSLYVERNVWLCFEDEFSHLLADVPPAPVELAEDAGALVAGDARGCTLVGRPAREVSEVVPQGSAVLVFADPPRPDGVFWALSALWAGWLWESPAAQALRPFLRRRRFDWEWHWRVLRQALEAAGPVLAENGYLVTFFSESDDALLASVCLAGSSAGYLLEGWGYSPEVGYRLVWRWNGARPVSAPVPAALEGDLVLSAGRAVPDVLRQRGEPTAWPMLHAAAYARLVEQSLLAQVAAMPEDGPPPLAFAADAVRRSIENEAIERLVDDEIDRSLWWLVDPTRAVEPLADRVEVQVWELLLQEPAWQREDLVNATCSCFPGGLTPHLGLVLVCIDSYSVPVGDRLGLRPEDNPLQRATERKALCGDLEALGARLGFEVEQRDGWDVCWQEEGGDAYVFNVSVTATLADHLLRRRAAGEGAQRCLVLPGGRAQLVTFKLQRDPRLPRALKADAWQFIKYRHLRRLVAKEELDRHALKTVLGLDPIAEREVAQIPLF